jgi:hypothetical protein
MGRIRTQGRGADGCDNTEDVGWGAAQAGARLRQSGRSRAALPAGTTRGFGDLPAGRQRLQHADATAGDLHIAATLEFPEDAIDHIA